jgi:hypothetical protein
MKATSCMFHAHNTNIRALASPSTFLSDSLILIMTNLLNKWLINFYLLYFLSSFLPPSLSLFLSISLFYSFSHTCTLAETYIFSLSVECYCYFLHSFSFCIILLPSACITHPTSAFIYFN